MDIIRFDTIDSTSSYLKREWNHLPDSTVVISQHQTAGKGRIGREWKDDTGSLLFSILLKEKLDEKRIHLLPLLCGTCLYEVLEKYGISSSIKWPNDVLIGGKKCAGILLESIFETKLEALVIGIGINVNSSSFDGELKDKATSLFLSTRKKFDMERFFLDYLQCFFSGYEKYLKKDDGFLAILRKHSYLEGKTVLLDYYHENRSCLVLGINDDGSLKVKEKDRVYSVFSGEATLQANYRK